MSLKVGPEHAFVFHWRSEYGDVPPQMEIMLQLVVDEIESNLRRVGSKLPSVMPVAATAVPSTVASTSSV